MQSSFITCLTISGCVLFSQAVVAEMSKSGMSAARESARHVGRMAAAIEACGVIGDRLKTRIVKKAEGCKASSDQIERLEAIMDEEQGKFGEAACGYGGQSEAEKVLDETVSKLDDNIDEGNCD